MSHESPIAPEGVPFIISAILITSLCMYFGWTWAAVIFGLTTLFITWFFRNPQRHPPGDPKAIISPCDGKVIRIETVESHELLAGPLKKISIFMNVFNVHVNRIPYGGVVEVIRYYPGKFLTANLDKASAENERNALVIGMENGEKMLVIQIAGLVARRIVCWVAEGMNVSRGQRFGLIRFGSRLDVFLSPRTNVCVRVGDKVRSGETTLGDMP